MLDTDKMLRDRAEITGLPSNNLKSQEDVAAVRQERAEQQAAQAKTDQALKASEAAKNAAPFMEALQKGMGATNGQGAAVGAQP